MSPQATRRRSIRLEAVPSPSSTGSPPAFPSPQNSTPDDSQENSQNVVADLLLKYAPAPDNKGAMMQMMHPAHAALLRSPGKLAKMKGKASSTKSTIGYQALKDSLSEKSRSQSLLANSTDESDDDEEAEQQPELEDEDAPISDAVLAKLDVDELLKDWKRCSLELNGVDQVDLMTGDLVVIRGGKATNEWVGEVRQIKSLLTDTAPLLDDEGYEQKTSKGTVKLTATSIYIQNAWAYSMVDLKKLKEDPRIHPFLRYLGPLEYVMTDNLDWHKQVDITGLCIPVFDFDDAYPASTLDDPDAHPLQYRPSRKHRLPPLYFFADRGETGGKDAKYNEAPTAKYIRTMFNFNKVSPAKGKGKGKATRTRTRSPTTIKLNLHSTSKTPYTPSLVQHYSRLSGTWYHTSDLLALGSYRSSSASSSAETDYEQEPTPANGRKRRAAARPSQPTAKRVKDATSRLEGLAYDAPIVRGGAYGLIGNSYLVTRAAALLGELDEDAVEEGKILVAAAEEWADIVERRTRSGLERGRAPGGATWVCPVSGVAI